MNETTVGITSPEPLTVPEKWTPDVGDIVGIVYWSPAIQAGRPGQWDTAEGRVISAGRKMVCFETAGSSWCGDGLALQGTKQRIVPIDQIYPSVRDAEEAAAKLPLK